MRVASVNGLPLSARSAEKEKEDMVGRDYDEEYLERRDGIPQFE